MRSLFVLTFVCICVFAQSNYVIGLDYDGEIPDVSQEMPIRDKRFYGGCSKEDCRNHGDGMRGLEPCGPAYCQCVYGKPFLIGCPMGTVFDSSTNICNWSYNVAGC
ncbi:hypothetical protein CBL_02480 [Carabus blaptoides fortunei]